MTEKSKKNILGFVSYVYFNFEIEINMPGVKNKLYWKYERVYYRIHTIHKPSIYTKTEDAKTWRAAGIESGTHGVHL